MERPASKIATEKPAALYSLSIQQRLPFFICILLLAIILTFSWVSYIGVKNASISAGTERLTTLSAKLSTMFKASTDMFAASAAAIAGQKKVGTYVATGNAETRSAALDTLKKWLKNDSTCVAIQVWGLQKHVILYAGSDDAAFSPNIDSLTHWPGGRKEFAGVGGLIFHNSSLYCPAVAPVQDKNKIIGHIVYWRVLKVTQQSVDQFAQLLGSNGRMYFGNDDGKFWTDLVKPAEKPPVELNKLADAVQYSRNGSGPVIGIARQIPNSRWLALVEFSTSSMLQTANLFLKWIIIVGLALVIAGSLGGWLMSRNITTPLKQLNRAAAAIAEGDYTSLVDVSRQDELGNLAESFNIMAVKVRSAQQQLERKVRDSTRELQVAITDIKDQKESEKRKDEFISVASHELKTPLTTLKAFFQLATREIGPESKSFNFISKAAGQLNRMENLIEDLLDVSKINSGKMQYNLEDFDFHGVLIEAIDNMQQISPAHAIILQASVPVTLNGDRHRIEQVITNLLNNAVKYSPGSDKVLIRSQLQDGKVIVTIEDFGIGIAEEHINQLFKSFYRVHNQHRFQGLGLGLFISSEIVKRHGGSIGVKSTPGTGSLFTFELPVKDKLVTTPQEVDLNLGSEKKKFG